ncbi:MAG: DUF1684 domain-containing protein [Ignavibacteriaceae bacterium]|nr:DUF1684 domain-containing protein [Ignavibacteriaceae bacterium]
MFSGRLIEEPSPDAVIFARDNQTYRIDAIGASERLWLIFARWNSGEENLRAGRILYTDRKADWTGKVIVDFNKAYNPPCVLTKFATCPLPPKENYMKLRITAGEKMWGENH